MADEEYEYYSEEEGAPRSRSHSHGGAGTHSRASAASAATRVSLAELEAERTELLAALGIAARGSEPLAEMDASALGALHGTLATRLSRAERELAKLEELYRTKKASLSEEIASAKKEDMVVSTVTDLRRSLDDVNAKIVAQGGVALGSPRASAPSAAVAPAAAAAAAGSAAGGAAGPVPAAAPATASAAPTSPSDDDPMRPFTTKELGAMFRTVTAEHPGGALPGKVCLFFTDAAHAQLVRLVRQLSLERDPRVVAALVRMLSVLADALPGVAPVLVRARLASALVGSLTMDGAVETQVATARFLSKWLWAAASDARVPASELSSDVLAALLARLADAYLEIDETLFHELVHVVLTLNLHYDAAIECNPLLEVLSRRHEIKALLEELPRLLNRGVAANAHAGEPIYKLLEDMFSCPLTVDLLYVSDQQVVLDVLLREVSDLDAGSPLRTFALRVLAAYIATSDYASPTNQYRIGDFQRVLDAVLGEEGDASESARAIVESIYSSCDAIALHKPASRGPGA